MSDTDNKASEENFNEADSRADAVAIFFLVMIAAGTMIYLAAG